MTADPNVLAGSPYVSGTRVPVRRLWAFYKNGTKIETLLKRYPQLGPARVLDALAFALDNQEVIEADLLREQQLLKRVTQRTPGKGGNPEQIELPFAPSGAKPPRG